MRYKFMYAMRIRSLRAVELKFWRLRVRFTWCDKWGNG